MPSQELVSWWNGDKTNIYSEDFFTLIFSELWLLALGIWGQAGKHQRNLHSCSEYYQWQGEQLWGWDYCHQINSTLFSEVIKDRLKLSSPSPSPMSQILVQIQSPKFQILNPRKGTGADNLILLSYQLVIWFYFSIYQKLVYHM